MVIVNDGLNRTRDLLDTDIVQGDWGTGTATEVPTDTDLETEIASIEVTTTNVTKDKTLQVAAVLPSTSGGTAVVTEHVLRHSDGTTFRRTTFAGITKSASKEIHNISTTVVQTPSI